MKDFEYEHIRDGVLSKFTDKFEEKATLRAYDRAVLEMLIRGADPYLILEEALDTIWEQSEKMHCLSLKQPPAPIVIKVTKEQFEKIKLDLMP